jgi:hypothetical protein
MLSGLSQAGSSNIYHQLHQKPLTTIKNRHHPTTKLQTSVAQLLLNQIKQKKHQSSSFSLLFSATVSDF